LPALPNKAVFKKHKNSKAIFKVQKIETSTGSQNKSLPPKTSGKRAL